MLKYHVIWKIEIKKNYLHEWKSHLHFYAKRKKKMKYLHKKFENVLLQEWCVPCDMP